MLGGFKGMAEGGTIGATATIANAVADALAPLGIKATNLPLSPERIATLVAGAAGHRGKLAPNAIICRKDCYLGQYWPDRITVPNTLGR
jgi:hypothetical protein